MDVLHSDMPAVSSIVLLLKLRLYVMLRFMFLARLVGMRIDDGSGGLKV